MFRTQSAEQNGNSFRNLFKKKFYYPEEDRWISLNVSANGIRTINKIGLKAALKNAKENGIITTI